MSFTVGFLPGTRVYEPYEFLSKEKLKWMKKDILSTTGINVSRRDLKTIISDLYENEFQGKGLPPSDYTMLDAVKAELYLINNNLQEEYDPTRLRMYYNQQQLAEDRIKSVESKKEQDTYWSYKTKESYDDIYNPEYFKNKSLYSRVNRVIAKDYFRDINSNGRTMALGESTDQEKTANKGLENIDRNIYDWNFTTKFSPDEETWQPVPPFANTF